MRFGLRVHSPAATIKVIIVGNGGCGKSSMAARYCRGVFTDSYKKTIGAYRSRGCPDPAGRRRKLTFHRRRRNAGVDFLEKSIELENGETVKLMCWDTAGQEEFDALTASYYRGASRPRGSRTLARAATLRGASCACARASMGPTTRRVHPLLPLPCRRRVLRHRLLHDGPRVLRRAG
jgi:hypothetical protein